MGIVGVVSALFGLLALPLIVQEYYGVDAFKTAFAVIVFYALVNWYMKRS